MKKIKKLNYWKDTKDNWNGDAERAINSLISHVESLEKAQEEIQKLLLIGEEQPKTIEKIEVNGDTSGSPSYGSKFCTCEEPMEIPKKHLNPATKGLCIRCCKPLQDTGVQEKLEEIIKEIFADGCAFSDGYEDKVKGTLSSRVAQILAIVKDNHE